MKQGHILVVDDLPDVRNTVTGMLSDEGYFVSSASSREEALQKLDAEHFNVAVLDVRLDDSDEANQDGLRLMYDISKKDPTTAVIILTGYADVKMVQEALRPNAQGQSPAFDFLEKSEIEDLPKYVNLAFEYSSKISKNDPQNEIEQALLDSLQTHLADMGQYNIMVEGQTDKAYLELAAQRFYEETKIDLLENGEVHIISTDGTKKLGPLLGALQSLEKQGYHFVFIFDGDDVGRRAADGMHRFHAQKNRQFFQLERTEFKDKSGKSWDVEIEDLISWPLVVVQK